MVPKKPSIYVEWAQSIVRLRLSVPDFWWVDLNSRKLNDGKIASFNESLQKWMLILDSEPGTPYAMAYPAIYEFADP